MAKQLTAQQISDFIRLVENEGRTPEQAALVIGEKAGSIRNLLKESGYRVRTKRVVEPIEPILPASSPA